MENKLHKPQLNLDWMDGPIKSEKWRNLLFDKSGKSYRGHLFHSTEEAAKAASNAADRDTGIRYPTMDGWLYEENYSYTIQIPVKE